MKFNTFHLFFALTAGIFANAQQDTIPKNNKLDEVVITGQYNPQSVRKSVFQVNVITRADIDRQAGNNLADLLNQTLNISITPNNSTGKSGVKLFGLDSQYFKILVDNVPLISDEGLGNNMDLTQINLDDVQQIEIVEGSMGVEYGANAITGIINIITKKGSAYKWEITPYIQEESVGDEYNMNNLGRHIQSLKVGHNFNKQWYANATVTYNDFKGFLNDFKGKNYPYDDGLRGYEWLPKKQFNAKSMLTYNLQSHRFFYKFDYFDEDTFRYDSAVIVNEHIPTATTRPTANDNIFSTQRFVHTFNGSGRFEKFMNYDVSFAYQQQKRDAEYFLYHIRTGQKSGEEHLEYESRKGFFSKGNFGNFLDNETIDFQVGYEISEIKGFSSSLAVEDPLLVGKRDDIRRELGSYDAFASTEINVNKRFSLRPGVRALFSSLFDTQAAVSLSTKYLFNKGYELRAIVGTAPRLPTYDELYTYFVDVNHDVQGNPNLNPEQGYSVFLHLNKTFESSNDLQFQTKLSAWYLDVKDKIDLVMTSITPQAYQYRNIDVYRTFGTSFTSSVSYKDLTLNAGITYSGVSKVIASQTNPNDDYLKGVQVNTNVSYQIPSWQTVFSAYLKYNGPEYLFVDKQNEAGDLVTVRGKQNDFTFVDATVRKNFAANKLEVTVGARNLLDVTRINTTAFGGGAHNGPASTQLLGYGRSYFVKLLYRLNF